MPTVAEVEARAREVSLNGIKNARREDRTMSTPTLTDFVYALSAARQHIREIRLIPGMSPSEAPNVIGAAYDYVGRYGGAELGTGQSERMIRAMDQLRDALDAADGQLKLAREITRAAVAAVDEADNRSRMARQKLGS